MKFKLQQQNIKQSETRIGGFEMSVELYVWMPMLNRDYSDILLFSSQIEDTFLNWNIIDLLL